MSFSSSSDCRAEIVRWHDRRCAMVAGWLGGFFVTMLLAAPGCRTAHYAAAKLPSHLDVPPVPPDSGINLAQMAGRGTGTSQISAGDLVEVTIASGVGNERVAPMPARVAEDGTVLVPLVGPVAVGGLEPVGAEQRIVHAAIERGVYRQPYVTVRVAERAVNRVTVIGAVNHPGVVELPRGSSDLVSALGAAGGLAKDASMQVDVLRHNTATFLSSQPGQISREQGAGSRESASGLPAAGSPLPAANDVRLASYDSAAGPVLGGAGSRGQGAGREDLVSPLPAAGSPLSEPRMVRIDLAKMDQPSGPNVELADRDVVMVLPEEKRVIHVTGLVQRPNQFEVSPKQDVHVLDAIAMGGGIKSPLADKVYVIRRLPDQQEPVVIQVSMARAKRNGRENLRLAPGDLVSVEATPATMISDTVSSFFRVGLGLSGNIMAF